MNFSVFLTTIFGALLHTSWNGMVKSNKDKRVAVATILQYKET